MTRQLVILFAVLVSVLSTRNITQLNPPPFIQVVQAAGTTCPIRPSGDFIANYSGTVTGRVQSGWFWQVQPLSSVLVEVQVLGGRKYTVGTDTSGHFNISAIHLPTKPGYVSVRLSRADFVAKNFAANLNEGDNPAPLTLDYPLAWSGTPKAFWGYVYEQVKDPNYPSGHTVNRNIAGAAVFVYREDDVAYSTPVTIAIADANGRYEIPAGRARIEQGLRYVVGTWNSTTHVQTGIGDRRLYPYDNPDLNAPYMSAQFNQSGQVDIRQDELVVEGKVTLKNTGWLVSDAEVSILQNNHRFPQPANPMISEADSATRVNSYGQYAITSWSHDGEVNPGRPVLVPGNATLQIQFRNPDGHLQPVFFLQSITIQKGRNVINPDIDAALVCGTLSLKDTDLTFPGVPIELKQGNTTQTATTNIDGNYQDFNENTLTTSPLSGTILSNYTVNVATSGQRPIKPGDTQITPKFSEAKDVSPPYHLLRNTIATRSINAGANNTSAETEIGNSNRIRGRILLPGKTAPDNENYDQRGYVIRLLKLVNGQKVSFKETTTNNLAGRFEFVGKDIVAGDYIIVPWTGTNETGHAIGPEVPVKVTSDIDQDINLTGPPYVIITEAVPTANTRYELTMQFVDQSQYQPTVIIEKVANIKVDLIKYDWLDQTSSYRKVIATAMTDANGEVTFSSLTEGDYGFEASKEGYVVTSKTGGEDFPLAERRGGEVKIRQRYSATPTNQVWVNAPTDNIAEFWFSPLTAEFITTRPNVRQIIDTTITRLRQRFPAYTTLPQTVGIVPATSGGPRTAQKNPLGAEYLFFDVRNWEETAKTKPLNPCPPDFAKPVWQYFDTDNNAESILLSGGLIEDRSGDKEAGIAYAVAHEWGHGKFYRGQRCMTDAKSISSFISNDTLGREFKDQYFDILTDSHYDQTDPDAGHPQESSQESYASAFHDSVMFEREFKAAIDNLQIKNSQGVIDPVRTKNLRDILTNVSQAVTTNP